MTRELDGFAGGVGARAGNDRDPAFDLLDAPLHDLAMLVMGECRALAGGADRHQPVSAFGDLPIDEAAKCPLVHTAVTKRGDECSERAAKARLGCHDTILCVPAA